MEQLKIGDLTLTWLNGGVTHLDGGAMFGVVPKPLWNRKYPCNEKNQIELCTDPILIQVDGKNVLIESGIGNDRLTEKQQRNYGVTEESKIDESLAALGLTTANIDMVLMTHLHFDHVLGLAKWRDQELVPTFEHATIYVTEIEWNEMRHPNIRSKNTYWEQNWPSIQQQIQTFSGELEVFPGIKMIHTGGHSDGHAIVQIEHHGETLIHMADIMPTHAHKHVLWVLAYDDYPMDSIRQKQKWMEEGQRKEAWYIFYHDAFYRAIQWNEQGEVKAELKRKRT